MLGGAFMGIAWYLKVFAARLVEETKLIADITKTAGNLHKPRKFCTVQIWDASGKVFWT
jgi:hypothetical protein